MAWHFDPPVVVEAARFKPGDATIVIYRQIGPGPKDKRVTAIAFPGKARTPIYVSCNQTSGPVSESKIPSRGLAEALEQCWCCAPEGQSCTPGNQTGLGKALLVQCFK